MGLSFNHLARLGIFCEKNQAGKGRSCGAFWALIVLVFFSAGCANRQFPPSYQELPPKPPRITFVRNQNSGPGTVITTVTINDWVVGTLAPGEHVTLDYQAGLHYVTVKEKTVPLTLRNNREYFFLIEQEPNGDTRAIRRLYAKDAAVYMESENYHTGR